MKLYKHKKRITVRTRSSYLTNKTNVILAYILHYKIIFVNKFNKKGDKNMEKERYYSLIDHNGNFELRDYESNRTIRSLFELDDLLNEQDAEIEKLKQDVIYERNFWRGQYYEKCRDCKELETENQQLKQSQKQQNAKIKQLREMNKVLCDIIDIMNNTNETLTDMVFTKQTKEK